MNPHPKTLLKRLEQQARKRFGYGTMLRLAQQRRLATVFQNWTYLRHKPEDRPVTLWLMKKCLDLGEVGCARRLAMASAIGDHRALRRPRVREAMLGAGS